MPSVTQFARDLRALGSSAPLRAAYEASKKTGFHRVVFSGPAHATRHRSEPLELGSHVPSGTAARSRCLRDAHAIVNEGLRVFGRRVSTGIEASWATDPLTGKAWPENASWWEIDIRSDDRLSDVKFVWEAARHRDLVVLARAAVLDPQGPWLSTLERLLSRWCHECSPERGVNWYSSLELSLRAIAWSQVLALVGEQLPRDLRHDMDTQLIRSARHITVELPYTLSSMKNNHLLGDGLGLVVIGQMFPTHPWSKRWKWIGDRLILKQLARHIRPDGSMIEDSLSYHRFVLEMLVVRVLMGDAPDEVRQAMSGAADHLVRLGVLDGPVPQFGDWDEGRVLADSAPAGSVVGSTLLALELCGRRPEQTNRDSFDELAWYSQERQRAFERPSGEDARAREAGDWITASRGDWYVWFKVGSGPSHQHADLSSVWIRHGDNWILRDPGTGTYNGDLDVRNGFRTSTAHSVWHPRDVDQLGPHRAFRWLRTARGYSAPPLEMDSYTILFGWHDAFEHLEENARIARVVIVSDRGVVVLDATNTAVQVNWEMSLPLGPAVDRTEIVGHDSMNLIEGQVAPFRGWHSETYGEWSPSRWLTAHAAGTSLPTWGCGDVADIIAGHPGGGLLPKLNIEWGTDKVSLTVVGRDGKHHVLGASRG